MNPRTDLIFEKNGQHLVSYARHLDIFPTRQPRLCTWSKALAPLWFWIILSSPTWAQIQLSDDTSIYELGPQVSILVDAEGAMDEEAVIRLGPAAFQKAIQDRPNFGFSSATYWVKVPIGNVSASENNWLLCVNYPLLDDVRLFESFGSKLVYLGQGGDRYPFHQRPVAYRSAAFPLLLNQGEEKTFYLRIESQSSVQLGMTLYTQKAFTEVANREGHALGAYYGVMIVMALYYAFLALSTQDRSYWLYVGYLISYAITQLCLNGLAFQYLWPHWTWWNNAALPFSLGLAG